jgi:hypothetical protein
VKRSGFAPPARRAGRPPTAGGVRALHDVLAVLADALAPYLRESLGDQSSDPGPVFYSQSDSPLGRRRHLELTRTGVLTGRKVGRRVLVLREDVHSYIDGRHDAPRESEEDGDVLVDWGLCQRGARQ